MNATITSWHQKYSSKFAFESPANNMDMLFCSCILDLDPVTLLYDADLDIYGPEMKYLG